jgi:hypothetical protein
MKRPKFVMNAKSGMWRVGIAVIAVLIGLFVIGRWVILELVDLAMGTRSVTDLPARVSKASPALQSMFFELAQFIRDDDGRLRCARHSGRVDGGGCGEV